MLMLIDGEAALPGTPIRIWSETRGEGLPLLFSHGRESADAPFLAEVQMVAAGRGQGSNRPLDIPGWAVPRERGCYQIWVEVDGKAYGPFGWNVV